MDPLKSAELINSPNRFLSWLFFGTKLIGAIVVVALGALYYNQEKLLYFPTPPGFPVTPDDNPPGFRSPGEYTKDGQYQKKKGRPEDSITFEDVMVKTEDGELIHTWLLLRDDSDVHHHPTLIYFHGNAGNMGFRLQNAVSMFRKSKLNILMMDYRGFGKSTGHPTENGIKADGDAVLKYAAAHPKLKGCPLIVFGRSLGGAVSFYLADKFPDLVQGIVVENTFLSINKMVDIVMPILKPLKFLMTIDWSSDRVIGNLLQPILFISGDSDNLVPPSHMKGLFELALKSIHREFYTVFGGNHNDSWEVGGEEYYRRLKHFVDAHVRGTIKETESERKAMEREQQEELSRINQKPFRSTFSEELHELITPLETSQVPVDATETALPATLSSESVSDVDEKEYFIVKNDGEVAEEEAPKAAIPTMQKNFQVK